MSKRNNTKNGVYFVAILVLVLVMLFSGLQILESTVLYREPVETQPVVSRTITRDGIDYYPRQDIRVMMVLGIDQYGPVESSGFYTNPGAADMIALLVFDETNEQVSALCLNRDTMVEMPVLGLGGKQAGTWYGQITMSHTYGSGLEDSCENTRKTVSDFLNGITIDHYVSMNMDAIAMLNDAVGGVTVTIRDDFSAVDPSLKKGELTLRGEQAINFVRTRKGVGDQLNLSRMDRQREYMQNFVSALRDANEGSSTFVINAYEKVSPYIVTDCSAAVINDMLQRYSDYTLTEMVSPEGENVMGEEYYEFHVDEEKLDALILRLFYAPK